MNKPPFPLFYSCINTPYVAGGESKQCSALHNLAYLLNVQMGTLEMLKSVPQAGHIKSPVSKVVFEKIAVYDIKLQLISRKADTVLGDINPLDSTEIVFGNIEEKTIGAAEFEKIPASARIEICEQDLQTQSEIFLEHRFVGHIIAILVTKEVVPLVKPKQFVIGQIQISKNMAAFGTLQQSVVKRSKARAATYNALMAH